MSEALRSLFAEEVVGPQAWELSAQFDELDRGASFATSGAWCRAAAQAVGDDRLVHVVLRDDARAVVGLAVFERSSASWRSGSPGQACLTWPRQTIGYRYGPRFDQSFSGRERSSWLSAVRALFPATRIELSRTMANALPMIAVVADASRTSLAEGAGTWLHRTDGGRELYLAGLKGKHRRDLAKYRRDIDKAGAEWIDCDGTADASRAMLAACFELHAGRLAEKNADSAYLGIEGRCFLEALVDETRTKEMRLSLLRLDGRCVAGCLAFVDRGRYWAVMSGWDRSAARLDLGRQVIYHQVLREFELGLCEIDLLGGDLDYKREFGLAKEPTLDLVVCPTGGAAKRAAFVAGALGLYRTSRSLWKRTREPAVGR